MSVLASFLGSVSIGPQKRYFTKFLDKGERSTKGRILMQRYKIQTMLESMKTKYFITIDKKAWNPYSCSSYFRPKIMFVKTLSGKKTCFSKACFR